MRICRRHIWETSSGAPAQKAALQLTVSALIRACVAYEMSPWLATSAKQHRYPCSRGAYHLQGKPGNFGWKSNGSRHSIWEGFRKYRPRFDAIQFFQLFYVCSADLDIRILPSEQFSLHVKFYSLMFIHKSSIRVVCVNGKHPQAPKGLKELPEIAFEFSFKMIGKSTMAFLTGQSWRPSTQVGAGVIRISPPFRRRT